MTITIILASVLLLFGIVVYVILDGFTLGIGILFPWAQTERQRNVMISTIAPVWDGNATWLIYSGGVLFAAFPVAYSVLLSAFYIPVMLMILAFILRGIVFEFRLKATKSRWMWDTSFALGSTIAVFSQGMILGALIEGVPISDDLQYNGNGLEWLSSFSITSGMALTMGYALLGSTWMIKKTKGEMQDWARSISKPVLFIVIMFICMISLKTPLENPHIAQRWFSMPNFVLLSPVPLLTAYCVYSIVMGLNKGANTTPFAYTIALYMLGFLGLGISLWPYIIFPTLTLQDSAAHENSLDFLLIVLAISLPIVVGYTAYVYRLFQGKVDESTSYYK